MLPILHLPYKMKVLSVQLRRKKKSASCFAHSTTCALSIRVVVILVSVNAFDTQRISEVTDVCYPTVLVAATLTLNSLLKNVKINRCAHPLPLRTFRRAIFSLLWEIVFQPREQQRPMFLMGLTTGYVLISLTAFASSLLWSKH